MTRTPQTTATPHRTKPGRFGSALILGKFMPPHRGHRFMVDFAQSMCADLGMELTILMDSPVDPPIAPELRLGWMREAFPGVRIEHAHCETPQEPPDDEAGQAAFWAFWRDLILDHLPDGPDLVFGSETYCFKIAELFSARAVPVDVEREQIGISATMIRESPMKYWDHILDQARPHFLKRVCIAGPESTGKTTLARDLADHFNTRFVTEYARPLLNLQNDDCFYEDIDRIARGHKAAEEAMARQARKVLLCDTDMLTTTIWSDYLFGKCPEWIRKEAPTRHYDLTLLLEPDTPFVQDPQRFSEGDRDWFLDRLEQAYLSAGRKVIRIDGSWQERFENACEAIEEVIGE